MPNLVQELNSLDFGNYIGGPMQAAIQAQHAASMSLVNFIQEVGFEEDNMGNKKLRYVDFEYEKATPNPHFGKTPEQLTEEGLPSGTDVSTQYLKTDVNLKLPFIGMLTLPNLKITNLDIDFNAKLTSVSTRNVSSQFAAKAELGINYKIVNFKASASYKRSTSQGLKVEKTYNLGVKVSAMNDDMPPVIDRVLTLIEDSVVGV